MKKAFSRLDEIREMSEAVEALAKDMGKVGRYMRAAERSLDKSLSRHIGS